MPVRHWLRLLRCFAWNELFVALRTLQVFPIDALVILWLDTSAAVRAIDVDRCSLEDHKHRLGTLQAFMRHYPIQPRNSLRRVRLAKKALIWRFWVTQFRTKTRSKLSPDSVTAVALPFWHF